MNNDTQKKVNTLRDDTHDTADEAKNRAQAAAEQAKRAVAGDSMNLGDKIKSNVNEALHKTKADFDAAKRDARHEPDPG